MPSIPSVRAVSTRFDIQRLATLHSLEIELVWLIFKIWPDVFWAYSHCSRDCVGKYRHFLGCGIFCARRRGALSKLMCRQRAIDLFVKAIESVSKICLVVATKSQHHKFRR